MQRLMHEFDAGKNQSAPIDTLPVRSALDEIHGGCRTGTHDQAGLLHLSPGADGRQPAINPQRCLTGIGILQCAGHGRDMDPLGHQRWRQ